MASVGLNLIIISDLPEVPCSFDLWNKVGLEGNAFLIHSANTQMLIFKDRSDRNMNTEQQFHNKGPNAGIMIH